jgi:AraC-like DNA-binding protein
MIAQVTPVSYRPHDAAYRLDIEVLAARELRARVASDPQRGFERTDFQAFVFVRSGSYSHVVDFQTYQLDAGACLLIGPGQVHRFGPPSDWDGWTLIVKAHLIPDLIQDLPTHVQLPPELAGAVAELLARMQSDAAMPTDRHRLEQLLALQSSVLVSRLTLGAAGSQPGRLIDPALLSRYKDYRAAVDRKYRQWHLVAPYAHSLRCSPKSLTRACRAAADLPAKRVITGRIVLEAKRLLARSADPVAAISSDLGFDEATNFVKFFRRETGTTPAAFRTAIRHGGQDSYPGRLAAAGKQCRVTSSARYWIARVRAADSRPGGIGCGIQIDQFG